MAEPDILVFMSVETLLSRVQTLPWNASVYFERGGPTNLDSECAVIRDEIQSYGLEDCHPVAEQRGLTLKFGIAVIQDIVLNAEEQISRLTAAQLLEALHFYIENDAFIEFSP